MSGTVEADWGSTTYAGRKWSTIVTDVTSQTLALDDSQASSQLRSIELPAKRRSWATANATADFMERASEIWAGSAAGHPQVLAYFTAYTKNAPVSEPNRVHHQFGAIERDFLVLASRIHKSIYPRIRDRFSALIHALESEDEPREIKRESLRYALQFLENACPRRPPAFSLTGTGDFYLQWFDRPSASIAGITFRANGQAIWSASGRNPHNPAVRDAAAGTTLSEDVSETLRAHAPWIF